MKFSSKPIQEHAEAPLADEGRWEQLIAHWNQREQSSKRRKESGNRCYVASFSHPNEPHIHRKLDEITGLVEAQNDHIVNAESLTLHKPDPRTYISKGLAQDLAERARAANADLFVLDVVLTPSQMRNLEDLIGLPVSDREAIILNVFQLHARTRAARMQVEIAHLEYLRPRIRGLGLNMDQQAGGIMKGRGPGETASEMIARTLDKRLADLRRGLSKLERQSTNQRQQRTSCHRIVFVGYTNAGKTSLMNALTPAEGSVKNRPFETLDTLTRCLTRHGGDVLLSDTVGFIRNLPQRLFASFASTLSEIREASLLATVIDVSDPDWPLHLETTKTMLAQLKADHIPRLYLFNKRDQLKTPPSSFEIEAYTSPFPYMMLSSQNPEDIEQVRNSLLQRVRQNERQQTLLIPYEAIEATSLVYANCRVQEATPQSNGMLFRVEGPSHWLETIEQRLSKPVPIPSPSKGKTKTTDPTSAKAPPQRNKSK